MPVRKWWFAVLIASVAVPTTAAPDSYTVDPEHTYPSLEMSHMGLSVWRGKFNKTAGRIALDRAARTGRVEIQIDTDSIDFGLDSMHERAVRPDWLDVARYPTMTYTGAIQFKGDTPASVDGQLTLRGVTKPVKLTIHSFKCIPHPMFKKEVCGADAEGELDRADFGMAQYSAGGLGKIHLRIQVEALKEG